MVETVVVADDASPCTYDPILRSVGNLSGVILVRFAKNAGIARSLNAGLQQAARSRSQWLLTLDQDSTLSSSYLHDICSDLESAERRKVTPGCIAPRDVTTLGGVISYPITLRDGWPTTEEVVQSGTLWSVNALSACGGFDEVLAMDAVDSAACLTLRERGYHIVLSPNARIQHQWGQARFVSLFGHPVAATGHSAARRRSITRNRLTLFSRELRQSPVHAVRTLRRVASSTLLAATIETGRAAKLNASLRGLIDGKSS